MKRWRKRPPSWKETSESLKNAPPKVGPRAAVEVLEGEPPPKKRKLGGRTVVPACSLPQPSEKDNQALEIEKSRQRNDRQAKKKKSRSIAAMALHLRAGRTLQVLLDLQKQGVLGCISPQPHYLPGRLSPSPGLSAVHGGEPVLVLDTFTRHKVPWCDVAPIVVQTGPSHTTHRLQRAKVYACKQQELQQIGLKYRVVTIRKKVPWLVQVRTDEQRAQAQEDLIKKPLLASSPLLQVGGEKNFKVEDTVQPHAFDQVRQVKPAKAMEHARLQDHKVIPREITPRTTIVVWQLPEPLILDCRPWRCLACKRCPPAEFGSHRQADKGQYFKPTHDDICTAVPDALCLNQKKIGKVWFRSSFLIQMLRFLYETMSFRECRRKIADVILQHALANTASTHAGHCHLLLAALPTAKQLARIALNVFPAFLAPRIDAMQTLQAMYNGVGVRIDGHWKKAKTITLYHAGQKRRRSHPKTCLFAVCGTDGSLLAPVQATRAESWEDICPVLEDLLGRIMTARMENGIIMEHALPAFIATDSFHKHHKLLLKLCQSLGQLQRIQPESATPKGHPYKVAHVAEQTSAAATLIAGEPYHDVINARRCVSPKANDAKSFLHDHQELLCRLSAPLCEKQDDDTEQALRAKIFEAHNPHVTFLGS